MNFGRIIGAVEIDDPTFARSVDSAQVTPPLGFTHVRHSKMTAAILSVWRGANKIAVTPNPLCENSRSHRTRTRRYLSISLFKKISPVETICVQ